MLIKGGDIVSFFDVYALITLFTFYTLLISKTILQYRNGKQVIALGKEKTGFARYLELFFYLGLFFLTYLVVISAFNLSFLGRIELIILFETLATNILAVLIQTFAIILFAFALASFKDAWRIGVDYQNADSLITTGVFKYTRNPTYIAIMLLFLSYFLLYANFFFLGSLLFITFAFNHQIKKEETLLKSIFNEEYIKYKKQTPRYFKIK